MSPNLSGGVETPPLQVVMSATSATVLSRERQGNFALGVLPLNDQ